MNYVKKYTLIFLGLAALHNLILCSSLGLDSLMLAAPSFLLLVIIFALRQKFDLSQISVETVVIVFLLYIFILKPIINPVFPNEVDRLNAANTALNYSQLEVASFVRSNGNCPKTLSDISGLRTSKAVDPFSPTGDFFKIVERDNVCIVYSIGPDRVDDSSTAYSRPPDISIDRISSALIPSTIHSALCRKIGLCHAQKGDVVREVIRLQ
jgi:hypothetical protein